MKKKHPILIGCGAMSGIFLIVIIVGVYWLSSGPEGGVRFPNEMETYAQEYINEHKVLGADELLAYYDVTLSLDGSVAAIVTTTRVIYHNNGENYAIALADIEDIRHREEFLMGDIFEISASSGQTMKIEIAPMNGGESFKNVLIAAWNRARKQE